MTTSWWFWGTPHKETIDTIPVFRNFAFWGMFNIRGLRILGWYTYLVTLLWYLWRHRREYDLIHMHMLNQAAFPGVLAGRWLKKPTIVKPSSSGVNSNLRTMQMNKRLISASRQMLPMILKADRFVAINQEIVNELKMSGVSSERIVNIPNGVVVDELTRKINYKVNEPIRLIFVGRLHYYKGLDVLLSSFCEVLAIRPSTSWRLLLLGGGSLRGELEGTAKRLGIDRNVEFCGQVNNVSSYLTQADLFVLPSRVEGMSNALLEAMACGLPCITTSVAGNMKLVRNFENGLLVPSEDITALTEAIICLAEDESLRRRLGQAAYQKAKAEYSLGSVASRYVELYNNLLVEYRSK